MWDMAALAAYIECQPPKAVPYRLLTEEFGMAYRNSLEEVVAIVVSQLIEGRIVVVMPPDL